MPRLHICTISGEAADHLVRHQTVAADRDVAARHHRALRARQTLVGRALLRCLLAKVTGQGGGHWTIVPDPCGRPFVVDAHGRPGPDISIAHSGPWVACGLAADGRIGVDIEAMRDRRSVDDLAQAVLSPAERAAVTADGEPAFLAFWTMREALGKALGSGLGEGLAMDGGDLPAARNGSTLIQLQGQSWRLRQRSRSGFSLALAWSPVR